MPTYYVSACVYFVISFNVKFDNSMVGAYIQASTWEIHAIWRSLSFSDKKVKSRKYKSTRKLQSMTHGCTKTFFSQFADGLASRLIVIRDHMLSSTPQLQCLAPQTRAAGSAAFGSVLIFAKILRVTSNQTAFLDTLLH